MTLLLFKGDPVSYLNDATLGSLALCTCIVRPIKRTLSAILLYLHDEVLRYVEDKLLIVGL